MAKVKKINIGLFGCGIVGTGVVRQLYKKQEDFRRDGLEIIIKKIVDKDPSKNIFNYPWSNDMYSILQDDEIDIAVELIGGHNPAYEFIKKTLKRGKNVVTANKLVIDKHGRFLNKLAIENNAYLGFEAAVAGGIPIINAIQNGLVGDDISKIVGILNGTTNYILTRMGEGLAYEKALKEAQERGFAEADPSFDIEGKDAAQKLAILASILFKTRVSSKDVYTEGIGKVTKEDIDFSSKLGEGYAIKLLAVAERVKDSLELRVCPTLVSKIHPLAAVNYEINAIHLEGKTNNTFIGEGAGQNPAAVSVVSDIKNIALKIGRKYVPINFFGNRKFRVRGKDEMYTAFFLNLLAKDKPGTLWYLSGITKEEGVNVSQYGQVWKRKGEYTPVVLTISKTSQETINKVVKKIEKLKHRPIKVKSVMRVEALGLEEDMLQIFFEEIEKENIRKLFGKIDVDLYKINILTSFIRAGELSKLDKGYIQGRIGIWKSLVLKETRPFLRIERIPGLPLPIVWSSYDLEEVKKRGAKTIDEKQKVERREFELKPGDRGFDPIVESFKAYKRDIDQEKGIKIPLVVYRKII